MAIQIKIPISHTKVAKTQKSLDCFAPLAIVEVQYLLTKLCINTAGFYNPAAFVMLRLKDLETKSHSSTMVIKSPNFISLRGNCRAIGVCLLSANKGMDIAEKFIHKIIKH